MLTRSGDPLTVRIYRPDGIEMQAATGLADIELSALPMDGDYVIAVEGRIDNTASAAFTARVIEIGETARAIGIGAPVGGHIDAGQTERLTFTLARSEEHTSELQSLMRLSYAVFCLKKKKKRQP